MPIGLLSDEHNGGKKTQRNGQRQMMTALRSLSRWTISWCLGASIHRGFPCPVKEIQRTFFFTKFIVKENISDGSRAFAGPCHQAVERQWEDCRHVYGGSLCLASWQAFCRTAFPHRQVQGRPGLPVRYVACLTCIKAEDGPSSQTLGPEEGHRCPSVWPAQQDLPFQDQLLFCYQAQRIDISSD